MSDHPRIGVVGATGAVGKVTLGLLAERGYEHVRAFASSRSAGSRVAFGQGELTDLDAATLEAALADLPRAVVPGSNGIPPVLDLLVASGLSESRGQARRVLSEGGAYVNNARVTDPAAVPQRSDLLAGRWLLLRRGKRNLAVAEVTEA